MDLTPELLLEAKFAPARRGYDMNEVDDFLERCAEGLDVLLARLKSEFDRAERAEELLGQLRDAAPGAPTPAVTEAPAATEAAPAEAPVGGPPSVEEPMRILVAAERTAEAAIAEARAEAERIRTEAESVASTQRSEAEALLARSRSEAEAEARKAGEEARRQIEAEVLSLRRDRESLTDDVRTLRRWLDEQRSRLRTTARELQRLVDDPAALREVAAPELGDDTDDADHTGEADELVDVDDTGGELTIFDDEHADDGEPTQAVEAVEDVRRHDDDVRDHAVTGPSTNGADTNR